MNLELRLKNHLLSECNKLIERHHSYHNNLQLVWSRNIRRIASAPPKEIKIPEYWAQDPKFNPFYVRKNAAAIAKSIARKINLHTYTPHPPHRRTILKPNGGKRELTVFQIPDAAVSSYFLNRGYWLKTEIDISLFL